MLEILIYLYVFDLDICDIHLLRNCDRSELHHINHLLEQSCIGTLFGQQLYICMLEKETDELQGHANQASEEGIKHLSSS